MQIDYYNYLVTNDLQKYNFYVGLDIDNLNYSYKSKYILMQYKDFSFIISG